jgi:four helix bundle suffix protein
MAVRQVPVVFRNRTDRTDRTDQSDRSDLTDLSDQERWGLYAPWLEHSDPAVRANAVICLIHQANFLLDQQIEGLEREFVVGGGYSEQLAAARLAERGRKGADRSDLIPACPQCGRAMVLRTAKSGRNAGSQFWGCSAYPECRGACPLDGAGA